jgi:hypothetical protein
MVQGLASKYFKRFGNGYCEGQKVGRRVKNKYGHYARPTSGIWWKRCFAVTPACRALAVAAI